MTITRTAKRRRGSFEPDGRTQPVPEGALPCRSCGCAVTTYVDTPVETLTIFGQRNSLGYGTDTEILVTRCRTCAARRERAAMILHAHPTVAREHGNVGLDRLDAAMSALDVLGRTNRLVETLTVTDQAVRALIDAFAALGGWAAWSASSAAPGVCTTRRWGHVSELIGQDMRLALAGLLRRRLEVAKPTPPPSGRGALRGCAFCGVGTLVVKESDAPAAWGPEYRIPRSSVGGNGGETVVAHLCPVCRPALLATGAIGLPAVWLAAIRSRGYEPRSSAGVVSLSGVKPWAALPHGFAPNATPWGHIDLAALDHELAFTVFVRRAQAAR